MLSRNAADLDRINGLLYLTGISEEVHAQMTRIKNLHLAGPVRVYEASSVRGEATRQAVSDAKVWLVGPVEYAGSDDGGSSHPRDGDLEP